MILSVITLILKNLPLLFGLLTGLGRAIEKVAPVEGAKIDEESLAKLIEEITEREIVRIVEENKRKIIVHVPNEEDKKRQETLDELEKRLIEDQKRYEREKGQRLEP